MNRDEAAELLARKLYGEGIQEEVSYFYEQLESPSTPSWKHFHKHYAGTGTQQRQLYDFAVKEAIKGAILGLCIFFDGAAGYERVDKNPAIFTIGLNLYFDDDAIGMRSGEDVHRGVVVEVDAVVMSISGPISSGRY